MSINHFFSDIPHRHRHHHHPIMEPNSSWPSSLNFNLHHDSSPPPQNPHVMVVDKESLFEKPLTPSDVGKLNRLVIPKQHAEKYFPLAGDSGDKGLLLSFEDESGKSWRFRYSYWNSSQSYVLTKGWSRYVKEKQLDAGDVVLFQRHRADLDRLFIGWRRRGENCDNNENNNNSSTCGVMVQGNNGGGWSRGLMYTSSSLSNSGQHQQQQLVSHGGINVVGGSTSLPYQSDSLHAGSGSRNQPTNSKKFRLFGVNLECQLDESEPSTPDDGSCLSSQGPSGAYHPFYSQSAHSSNSPTRMDITFSQDVNQTRNRRG